MKYYLIALLFVIMGAGARTMFEVAYHAMGREHNFAPAQDTVRLMFLAIWFILMMAADILLLFNLQNRNRIAFIILLSIGVLAPSIYMFITH
ncbi:MAG: hypothetical protein U0V74_00760 [Chitinophagales bacterium]